MDELFGAPISSITVVLGILFIIFVGLLVYIGLRNPILVRMAVRNVRRRPARGVLIVVGLMLATAMISSAFTTGDSFTFSIKREATDSLQFVDEIIQVDDDSAVYEGKELPDEFSETVFNGLPSSIGPLLEDDPDIDGVLPAVVEPITVVNVRSQQFEVESLFTGLDPTRTAGFGDLKDSRGDPVDLASLGPNEVYIDQEGADEIDAQVGDVLGVALRPGALEQMTVKAIVDGAYSKTANTKVVLTVSLIRAQELLGLEGRLTAILISNRGDESSGVSLTSQVLERYEDLPIIRDNGLEVFDIKREWIDDANEVGSLFVSLFTTFGLFSIGVGLLLIFLIISMLAAERKSEMGMSRAVGMQRRHLVRLFLVEGAIYSLGSAIVGAAIGVGLGFLLVTASADAFGAAPTEDFTITTHVSASSVIVSFLLGSIITFVTILFASRRISRLNIVRAIRDIPEPQLARAGKGTRNWGIAITILGVLILFFGLQSAHLTLFGIGVSFIPIGIAMILRWKGVAQRWVLSGTGLILLAYWLLPPSVYNNIKDDWNQDFSIFFVSGALVVTGGVLLVVNNSPIVLGLMTNTLGRFRRLTPIIKMAVSYPLRFGFRTGLSVAMFAVVIFSVVVMQVLMEGFDRLFEDQRRLGGGYDVMAFARSDLNPVADLGEAVESRPELAFVSRVDGVPSVGTFRTFYEADARLADDTDGELNDTSITGFDDDYAASNQFIIKLATEEYAEGDGFDSAGIWQALRDKPGLAVVNSILVPARNNFGFEVSTDDFNLNDVDGLFIENDAMDPVEVTVQDLKSGTSFQLTVIGVLDDFASNGPMPVGIFTSTNTLRKELSRDVDATQFFFKVQPGTEDAADKIEAAFFQHGLETLDVAETIEDIQANQRAFFNLIIAYMTLGLVVGIVALGVVSARAVVERRHQIGMLRAIGFSRRMVQMTFLAESSFIAVVGISLGLVLGLVTSINVIEDTRTDEPDIKLVIPWVRLLLIGVGAYLFSLVTTFLPARQASRIAPAEALRYE